MPNPSSEIINPENPLLTAYSVQEIIRILRKIDENIVALHACSAEDFLTLNNHFKNYYRESKTISGNASSLFDIISGNPNKEFHNHLMQVQENVNLLSRQFEAFIEKSGKQVEDLFNQFNLIFVPLNNYRQNVSTLKYLAANLSLNARYESRQKESIVEGDSKQMAAHIEDLKQKLHKFDQSLTHARKDNFSILGKLDELRHATVENIVSISGRIDSSISTLSRKHKEAVKKIPVLREKTENSSSNIGKIITHLQYHDIIRQKIEHIQSTQQEILIELQSLEEGENEKTNLHSQAKVFMKIRDIAGLQAAQLLHANKQYQVAIENITNQFMEIGDNMATISALCQELSTYHEGNHSTVLDEVLRNLEDANGFPASFARGSANFEHHLSVFREDFDKLLGQFHEIEEMDSNLHSLAAKTLEDFKTGSKEEEKTLDQTQSLLNDIKASMKQAAGMIESCRVSNLELQQQMQLLSNGNEFSRRINEISHNLPFMLEILKKDNEHLHLLLSETTAMSDKIVGNIKTSIQNVKYYDYFEKMIDEIINELNTINIRLNAGNQTDDMSKENNLKLLKERYTMQSEHDIHDHIASSEKGNLSMLEQKDLIQPNQVDENDDNLELF